MVIYDQRDPLLDTGNEVLCLAAENRYLVLVRRLFESAKADPDFRAAILADDRKEGYFMSAMQYEFIHRFNHQSIGAALPLSGSADVVDFLCQQPGTGPHLRYVNLNASTVFHEWAIRFHEKDVLRIPLRHWPEGVCVKNGDGRTAVHLLILYMNQSAEDTAIELLQMMMKEGNVDASGKGGEERDSPLGHAARYGYDKLCRFLVVEGSADVYSLLKIDPVLGVPRLTYPVTDPDLERKELHEMRMLNTLCSSLPLTVDVEYLV